MEDNDKDDDNKDTKNDKGISALGLDKDLGFSEGYQRHQPHDGDDDDDEEDDDNEKDEVEKNKLN